MHDGPDPAALPLYRFHAHTGCWQSLAFQVIAEPNPDVVIAAIRRAINEAPREGTVGDRIVARSVLNEILAHLVRRVGLERDPDVGGALLALLTSCRSEDWTREALALLDHCALPNVPLVVRRALKMLDERYCEGLLDEGMFARQLDVSARHLRHALRTYTGRCFLEHLHARRTADAYPRIRDTGESLAAIATSVGYSDVKQLRRHVRRAFGVTPRQMRAGGPPRDR